jgi:hypothetical protein
MNRPILLLAGALCLAVPALAQDTGAPSGRYQIAPDEDGFVRLDTRTGAMTHCGKREGAWRCDVLADDRAGVDRRLDALDSEVGALKAEIGRLTAALSAMEKKFQTSPAVPPSATDPSATDPSAGAREEELDEALSFAERLMRRFFDMVRELKSEDPPTRT